MALDGLLHAVATTAQNLALAWLVAAVLLNRWLPHDSDRSIRAAALTMLVAQPVLLWLEAAVMADLPLTDAFAAIGQVARSTHYGAVWIGGTAGAVLLCVDLFLTRIAARSRRRTAWLALLLLAFAFSRTLISHAAGDGDLDAAILLDWAHLLLTSAWVGEVAVAAFVIGPGRGRTSLLASTLSRSATWLLAGILVTGFVKTWLGVGSLQNLAGNAYVAVLAVKLVFVAAAIGCGGFNRFVVMPLMSKGNETRFFTVLKIESGLLACAMSAAAVLAATVPPTMTG